MQCPSCGAISKKRSMKCPECGVFRNKSSATSQQLLSNQLSNEAGTVEAAIPLQSSHSRQTRSLIEFPGARNSLPQWRKDLGERVREVQERRLRETALESGDGEVGAGEEGVKGPLLELLPQAEVSPLNPLVVAALRRIERAHIPTHEGGSFTNVSAATALAYAEQPEFSSEGLSMINEARAASLPEQEVIPQRSSEHPEKVHSLSVVPNLPTSPDSLVNQVDASVTVPKSRRLIGGDPNDPALNYLDSIPRAQRVDDYEKRNAPIPLRFFCALLDLVVIGLLSLLPLALVGLTDLTWQDPRVIAFAVATSIVVAFLYLTICTALTGRTLGMRLFSLRIVDARTRMIPTGSQSAGRSLVYILSVVSTGLPLVYTLIDREKRAAHDRFTRTEVVRM